MPPTAIHQLVAGFSRGDAISNQALILRRVFASWGFPSQIFCETRRILPELRCEAGDIEEYRTQCRRDDLAILHLSIGSPVNAIFAALPCRKAILYHNITPPGYFRLLQPATAHLLEQGRRQVQALAGAATVNLADSRFNAEELVRLGYANPGVLPLSVDRTQLRDRIDRRIVARANDGKVNVLFVGRCAPNKKIEDALVAFAHFQRFVEPASRLILVGSHAGMERYYGLLLAMAREMQLENVVFPGSIPQAELNGWYAAAHLFLCLSEHEGFCIPLLESMIHGVPVIAYAAAAVPETLDGAGVLVRAKNYPLIAELMGKVVRDTALRAAIVNAQQARVERYLRRDLAAELHAHLAPLL